MMIQYLPRVYTVSHNIVGTRHTLIRISLLLIRTPDLYALPTELHVLRFPCLSPSVGAAQTTEELKTLI